MSAKPESPSSGLSIEDVSVTYPGGVRAVDHVSLHLPAGSILAVLGASGSGKSSLLRAVAGLEPVSSGRICFDGQDMTPVPVHKRGFGLMFQDGQLFPFRDVAGNVSYGISHQPALQQDMRVAEMLSLVGLAGWETRRVSTLSGGQAQRVALARALAPEPRLLLLDEPLSALDRALREQLVTDLRRIIRAAGTTALHVTHDQDEAMSVADYVAVMIGGRLAICDTPESVWANPGTRSVAEFLGCGPMLDVAASQHWGVPDPGVGNVWALLPGAITLRHLPADDETGGQEAQAPGRRVRAEGVRIRRGTSYVTVSVPELVEAQWEGQGGVVVGHDVWAQIDPSRMRKVSAD